MPKTDIMSDFELKSKAIPTKLQNDLNVIHCSIQSAKSFKRIKRYVGLRNGLIHEVRKVPEENIQLLSVFNFKISEYEDSILDLACRVGASHE